MLGCDSAGETQGSYPMSEVRGCSRGDLPHVLRSGAETERSYHTPEFRGGGERGKITSNERQLCRSRRAKRSFSMFKVSRGSHEEIPLIQGKEQQLHFAGAAIKRYPMSKVRDTQVRW